jgi:hypothetical protein
MPAHTHVAQFTGNQSNVTGDPSTTVSIDVGTNVASAMAPPAAGGTTYIGATTAKAGLTNVTFNGLFSGTAPDSTKATLGGITAQTSTTGMSLTPSGSVTNSISGNGQPLPIRNPYLGTNFIIALEGIFPSRN